MFHDLALNICLLVTLCWVQGMLMRYLDESRMVSQISAGVLFGTVCIIGMMIPLKAFEGLIFDGRTVVLSMAAFFGGPWVGGIAGTIASAFRLWLGGIGTTPGILNTITPVLMGLGYRYAHQHWRLPFNLATLLVFGLLMQGLQILNLSLLPDEVFALIKDHVLMPLLIVLLPATILFGLLLKDVYQQKLNHQALLESESYLRAITDAVPDLSMVLDDEGRCLKIKIPDNWPYAAEAARLQGQRLQDVLPRQQADRLLQLIHLTLANHGPQTREYPIQTNAGARTLEAHTSPLDTQIKGHGAVLLVAYDITERIELELNQRIAAIAFECQQSMLITDTETRIIKANQAFLALTGYSEAEIIGQPTRFLKSGRHTADFYRELWRTLTEGGSWEGEIWNRRKNGEIFPAWITISTVYDGKGELTHYVASINDISERKDAEQKISYMAYFDPLTGLPNRSFFRERVKQAMTQSRRHHHFSALIFLDLDDFKNVNDLYGHHIGDELLGQVAERLKHNLREGDTAARFGGDEFMILLEGLAVEAEEAGTQAEQLCRQLLLALRAPYLINGNAFNNSASIGIVTFQDEQHNVDELIQFADLAMYSAKSAGKNALRFYDPQMQAAVSNHLKMEQEIRLGLEMGEFVLFVQAQTNARGELQGAEALVRWQHPVRGLLAPGTFIPVAERSELIEQLDLETLRKGCQLLACWAEQPHLAQVSLSVNISAKLLYQDNFTSTLHALLAHSQANPRRLKLEITESLLLADKLKAVECMHAIRALGVRFSIDDFGTGYSSLAYLQQLPLDQLKIDQSFVRGLPDNRSNLAIVRAILAMAGSLELEVIAEGVETAAQCQTLLESGCQHFQGYLFGKPAPPETFAAQWQATSIPGSATMSTSPD